MKTETKKIRLPAKASAWYAISAVIGRGIGIVLTPIFTRVLTTEEYGLYSLYLTWLAVFTIPATLELGGGSVFVRALQKEAKERDKLICSAFALILCISAAICILYFAFNRYLGEFTGLPLKLTLLIFLQIILNSAVNLYLAKCKFAYKYRAVCVINVLLGAMAAPLSLLLIRLMPHPEWARIYSQIAVTAAVALPLLFIIFKNGKGISVGTMKSLFVTALPMLPHYICVALISRAEKLAIGALDGQGVLAEYSVADTVGSLTSFALGALFSAMVPWIMRKISAKQTAAVESASYLGVKLLVWLTVMLLAAAPELIGILAPPEYKEALFAVYPIAAAAIPYFLLTVLMTGLTHGEVGARATLPSLVGVSASAAVIALLYGRVHFSMLSLASLTAYTLMCVASYAIYKRRGGGTLVSLKKCAPIFLLCLTVAASLYLAADYPILRLIIAALAALPMLIDGRSAFAILKDI